VPVFALGGLRAEHVAAARAQGAHGLAVRGALFDSPDAAAAVGELLLALASCR
jgi:thiamine monophosphate synthase